MGCLLTQETRVQLALDDVAGTICQTLPKLRRRSTKEPSAPRSKASPPTFAASAAASAPAPSASAAAAAQGLTLVHFSAHLEPSLTQNSTLNTPYSP